LTTDGSGNLAWANVANGGIGNIAAGGSNTQIQYNDNGILGGNPGMTFNEGTTTLTANNFIATSTANLGNIGNVKITGGNVFDVIAAADSTGNLAWATLTFMEAAGSNSQVQYNDNGTLGGSPGFTYDEAITTVIANNLSVTNNANVGGNLIVTGTGSFSGNVNMNGVWINNVGYPNANSDVATKQYVDTIVSSGITYHAAVNAATTTTLAVATGGTTAYVEPNGAGNGIGAYISTTGTYTLVDGVNIATIGRRILVKDEANAAWNGIYTYSNATAIVRSTDADEYGTDSTEQISINDYFFTQAGTVNNGVSFIVSAPAGTITFGTSNITFSIFSSSVVYTAGTGINISGTVISANASQTQVTAVGNLTTLSVVGNANIGNVGTVHIVATGNMDVGNITATGNINSGNAHLGNLATANFFSGSGNLLSNIQGSNVTGNVTSAITANFANFAGNVTLASQPNITSLGTLSSLSVSGNANVGNLGTAGLITAVGNITGGNLITAGLVSATGNGTFGNINTSGAISATGNIDAGNINAVGTISANTIINIFSYQGTSASLTGNITGGNLITGGFVSATGNITGGNANLGNLVTANFFSGSGNLLSNIQGSNVTGNVTSAVTANFANYAGNVTVAAQGNITSLGTLTGLSVSGNVALTGANVSLGAVGNLHITGGSNGQVLSTNGAGGLSWVSSNNQIAGAYIFTQSSAANTWVVNHNLGVQYVNVEIIDNTGNSWDGRYNYPVIVFNNTTHLTVIFDSAQAGFAAVSSGGGEQGPKGDTGNANVGGSNTAVQFNDAGVFGGSSAFTFNKSSNLVSMTSLSITANANVGNIGGSAGVFSTISGNLTTPSQPNITAVGTLASLSVTGNITGGNLITGGLLSVAGNVTGANIIATTYDITGVATSISAAGSSQGDATVLAKAFNVVSTVSAGQGVVLPTAVAGMRVTIINTSGATLLVYPATGGTINALATNAGYSLPTLGRLDYIATSTTQWYAMGAIYV
jgi:hypothetical protein